MDNQRTQHHTNNIHQQRDDWDETHHQLLAIQKKSLEVSDPNDADEKEADEVARKVVNGGEGTINNNNSGKEGKLRRQVESAITAKTVDNLVLPEGDRIMSVQIQRDKDKKIVHTQTFLGPLFTTRYKAQVPVGESQGYYTFIVKTWKNGIKNITLYNYGGFIGSATLNISVKQPDPLAVKTNELKKFDLKSDPANDASLISDTKIKGTAVYSELYGQSTAKVAADKEKEAILATRLMLRDVQDPSIGTVVKGTDYLTQAKKQLGVKSSMETNFVVGGKGPKQEGSFEWHSENSWNSTDFSKWLNGLGPEPSTSAAAGTRSVNNCWGVIFFGAYKANYASKQWIADMYAATRARQSDPSVTKLPVDQRAAAISTVEDWISGGKYYNYDEKTKRPLAGDLVIWDTAYNHIVLATGANDVDGSPEVISLWTIPNHNYLQYTSIKKLTDAGASGKIKFFSPKWQ
jgi:hypothetical protein